MKRPCYLFPSVIGKAHNREEGGLYLFHAGVFRISTPRQCFPYSDNVWVLFAACHRGIIYHVPSESHFRDRSWCHCHSIAPLLFRVVVFVPLYSVLYKGTMANSRWSQSPSGSTSIRFRSRMVRGDGCSPPPFMWGPSIHRGKPVAELRLSSRGGLCKKTATRCR